VTAVSVHGSAGRGAVSMVPLCAAAEDLTPAARIPHDAAWAARLADVHGG
jgi:hypothetical protein